MEYRFFFFAGGDHRESGGNAFTTNFIQDFKEILDHQFKVIKGIYHHQPLMNVLWALNRAQRPVRNPEKNWIIASSLEQILADDRSGINRLVLVSSSYGSVVAAQTACYLAEHILTEKIPNQTFDLALGASMVSKKSILYKKLLYYLDKGIIGTLIYDELQDEGDNTIGLGGTSRFEAFSHALGICFPFLTLKYKKPSFLNKNPVTGHIHRVRAQSVQKAKDFVRVILVDYQLGGPASKERASLEQAVGSRQ
ncbi:MAG: hypothetical protein WC699_12720 [Bacteroidales bacterium]|jgi:hypothetical protein